MAKAMLIMDMPSSCKECPCVDELGYIRVCHCTGEVIESGYAVRRQDNCPLREIPQKKERNFSSLGKYHETIGYNACIDEILGGGE